MSVLIKAVRYAALPGIIPRIKEFTLNFGYFAYLMAIIFSIVRLLPAHHPYLAVSNMGRYGIRQVFAAAAQNLKGGFRNIDQYLIFGGFMVGLTLLILQFIILFAVIAIQGAQATSYLDGFGTLFQTARPTTDVAFLMLDSVFQIPGFFNSAAAPASATAITPFAHGLHVLFSFYSFGMLLIASLIILYYIFVLIVETAQTGHPFGERFDSVYAPIRLILCVALLVPTYYGLNSGQYLVLQVAKWGSSMATNAWLAHNNVILNNPYSVGIDNPLGLATFEYGDEHNQIVVTPKIEDIGSVVTFYQLASACRAAYKYQYSEVGDSSNPKNIDAYFVRDASASTASDSQVMGSQSFSDMMTFFQNGSFKIVFGEKSATFYKDYPGFVKPYCGSITLKIDSVDYPGARDIYQVYYDNILTQLWDYDDVVAYGEKTALIYYKERGPANGACSVATTIDWANDCAVVAGECKCKPAGSEFHVNLKMGYQVLFELGMEAAISSVRGSLPDHLKITTPILDLGWGGAGVWFNRLAEYNGAIVTAAIQVPAPTAFPATMEWVLRQKMKNQPGTAIEQRFSPNLKEGDTIDTYWKGASLDVAAVDMGIAKFLDQTYRELTTGDLGINLADGANFQKMDSNIVTNVINSIFGLSGLYQFRQNTEVNPISRLAALGKSILERSITYLGGALILTGVGGVMGAFDAEWTQAFSAVSGIVTLIGFSALSVGVILFYLLPMMPFLYFFFAVGRWTKSIFEAMVAVPLWALAHLKIDGDGIPGYAAANGYFLLLEIFIRPVLALMGLLASFGIFSALVVVLDTIFNLVVANVGGAGLEDLASAGMADLGRSALDEFIYTVFYTILVYMIGTSCFKLIDQIPNGILRWAGNAIGSFNDRSPDPMDALEEKTQAGINQARNLYDATNSGIGGAGRSIGSIIGSMKSQGTGGAAEREINASKQAAMASKMQNPNG